MKKMLLLALLLPVMAVAQKIKTKKDRVLIDEKEVAILNDKVRDQYILSDLAGTKMLTIEYKGMSEGDVIINQWLAVTSQEGKTTEIPYEVLITSFSPTKIILHLLSAKYNLLDANGFNKQKIDEFFAAERESISDKSLQAKVVAQTEGREKKEKISRYQPLVKNDGTIMFGGNAGTRIAGKAIGSPYTPFGSNNTASIHDLDGMMVANAKITGNADNEVIVTLFNDTDFTYRAAHRYSGPTNVSFFTELVGELVARDITLGHQAKEYQKALLAEKTKLAKERSRNIYNVRGYAVDGKGVKYDGIITAQFEMLDVNQTGNTEVVDAIDKYGKNVTIKYRNEKGNERSITLAAKDNVKFFVRNADGSETAYEGMKVKGDAAKKLSNAMSLGFNNAYFYRTLYSENGNTLLVDPVESDRFVIKLKSSEVGQMIDKRNNKSLSGELSEYLAACPALSKEIRNGAFDLKLEDNLVNIVKEFNTCR
ncbi:MAG TPA: hypothetical protein VGB50_00140 [Flavobacterium sp.]